MPTLIANEPIQDRSYKIIQWPVLQSHNIKHPQTMSDGSFHKNLIASIHVLHIQYNQTKPNQTKRTQYIPLILHIQLFTKIGIKRWSGMLNAADYKGHVGTSVYVTSNLVMSHDNISLNEHLKIVSYIIFTIRYI